jgi:polyisoprenoid-binding protein YceI
LAILPLLLAGQAHASEWAVDVAKSRLGFTGSGSGSTFQGRFKKFTAHITFDPAKPEAGHADVVVDMASAFTGDPETDSTLPESDWFDVKRFAQARFEAKTFRPKGGNNYEAVGALTIRNISHDLVLPFQLTITGDTAHATGKTTIVRSNFGVGQGTAGDTVALDVGVDVDVTATRVPGT